MSKVVLLLLLTNLQGLFKFYQFFHAGPFSIQDPTLHLFITSFLHLSWHWLFQRQLFHGMSLNVYLHDVLSGWDWCYAFLPRLSHTWYWALFNAWYPEVHGVEMSYNWNVELHHLVTMVFTRFLHCEVVMFPFVINILWGDRFIMQIFSFLSDCCP